MEFLLASLSILLFYLPFYLLSFRIFDKYHFPLSFWLFYVFLVFSGFILQFFRYIEYFPIVIALLYFLTIKFGTLRWPKKDFIISFLVIFLIVSLPYIMNKTLPFEGHDAAFHAYLMKRIVEEGSVFISWGLMFEGPVNYPFGFHLFATLISTFGLSTLKGTFLVAAAFLFPVFCFSVYPVGRELGLDRAQGTLAIFLCGFGSLFALFPNTWGGLAQLAGMSMLIFSFYFMLRYLNETNKENLFLFGLSSAALFISHYWMFVLFTVGVFSFLVFDKRKVTFIKILSGLILSFILISPWIYRIVSNSLEYSLGGAVLEVDWYINFLLVLAVSGPITLVLALYAKEKRLSFMYLWIALSLFLTQIQNLFDIHFGNPGRWIYGISAPLSILASLGAYRFWENYLKNKLSFERAIMIFILFNIVISGGYYTYSSFIKYPGVSSADYDTMEYIKNLPDNIVIQRAGTSGTWIPFMSNKKISNPMLSVTEVNQTFLSRINEFNELYSQVEWDKLRSKGVDYYFISTQEAPSTACKQIYKRLYNCTN